MIREYANGEELLKAHQAFLNTNPELSMFFTLDAPLLKETNAENYAVKAGDGEEVLLFLKVVPFSVLVFGSEKAAPEMVDYLMSRHYVVDSLLGSEAVCDRISQLLVKFGIEMEESLAMDFMEAREMTSPSCPEVEIPTEVDLDEIVECMQNFVRNCGLRDAVVRETIQKQLADFRILRKDGRIASMARYSPATGTKMKISYVYTRPEYRGQNIARKLVNTVKNEILEQGMIAVLNVDKKNPISNHLYTSLGFTKVFSQGQYFQVHKEL